MSGPRVEGPSPGDGAACGAVLRDLPEWFGIESAIEQYERDIEGAPTFVVAGADGAPAGFLTVRRHGTAAAEIHVIAVRSACHGQGLGTALVEAAEAWLRGEGVTILQVKTVGPSSDDAAYARTRIFYETRGFTPLEEFPTLWDERNPCLVMVKSLGEPPPHRPDPDDETLRRGFEDGTLPVEAFTHRSHVRMAYLYLVEYPFDEALARMRAAVRAFGAAHGVPRALDRGYHDTVTVAWMHVVAATLGEYGPHGGSMDFCTQQPQLMAKKLLRLFYSRDRLMTWEAKDSFVEPDLAPLPVARETWDPRPAAG